MIDITSGTVGTITIPLLEGKAPLVPEAGSVFYSILDQTGAATTVTARPVTTDVTTHTLRLELPAEVNTIAEGRLFEKRVVLVTFRWAGSTRQIETFYRVLPRLAHTVTPDDVRNYLGISEHEISDESIDLPAAYFYVEADFKPVSLATVLTSGTVAEIAANTCITLQASSTVPLSIPGPKRTAPRITPLAVT